MHACIAAVSQGVPTVALGYSRKFIGVFDSIGTGEMVIDARCTDENDAIDSILQRFQSREGLARDEARRVHAAQESLSNTFRTLLALGAPCLN